MVRNGLIWFEMVRNGLKWFEMVGKDGKGCKVLKCSKKHLKM